MELYRQRGRVSGGFSKSRPAKPINRREKARMDKEIFGKTRLGHITKGEFSKKLRELNREKARVKLPSQRIELGKKIRYLKDIGGEQ